MNRSRSSFLLELRFPLFRTVDYEISAEPRTNRRVLLFLHQVRSASRARCRETRITGKPLDGLQLSNSLNWLKGVSEKWLSLCLSENLCASVVKLLKMLTTETPRSHRDTEINFSRKALEARRELSASAF